MLHRELPDYLTDGSGLLYAPIITLLYETLVKLFVRYKLKTYEINHENIQNLYVNNVVVT